MVSEWPPSSCFLQGSQESRICSPRPGLNSRGQELLVQTALARLTRVRPRFECGQGVGWGRLQSAMPSCCPSPDSLWLGRVRISYKALLASVRQGQRPLQRPEQRATPPKVPGVIIRAARWAPTHSMVGVPLVPVSPKCEGRLTFSGRSVPSTGQNRDKIITGITEAKNSLLHSPDSCHGRRQTSQPQEHGSPGPSEGGRPPTEGQRGAHGTGRVVSIFREHQTGARTGRVHRGDAKGGRTVVAMEGRARENRALEDE